MARLADEFEVEAVVGRRHRRGATEYLVQWKGFAERTWEPARNLSCDELVREYELRHAGSSQESSSQLAIASAEERGRRFLLVADGWGARASSTVLALQQPERGQQERSDAPLRLECVTVDAQTKSVAVIQCDVEVVGGATLPPSALLVAARFVEDDELAIRFILLAFLDRGSASSSQTTSDSRKRRRSATSDSQRVSLAPDRSEPASIYFLRLSCVGADANHAQLVLLNCVALPSALFGSRTGAEPEDLQILLADGPHAVVFSRSAQQLAVLRLVQDGDVAEFRFWREAIDVAASAGADRSAVQSIRSCEFVDEAAATRAHLLIGVAFKQASARTPQYGWLVYPTDELLHDTTPTQTFDAVYVPDLTSQRELSDERVLCCCLALKYDVTEAVSPVHGWMQPLSQRPPTRTGANDLRVDLSVGTFLVVGTTRNSVFVYANGLLLASLVLSATPEEIVPLGYDSEARRYVIVVRCSNLNRSCFLLAFNTVVRSNSIEILQAFNHVGEALVGEFSSMDHASNALSAQMLLLNHLPASEDALLTPDGEKLAYDPQQLVKRSVLLHQPSAKTKTVCIRLRLRDGDKTDSKSDKARGVKRSRSRKGDGSTAFRAFKYIERTHKGAAGSGQGDEAHRDSLGSRANGADPEALAAVAASHAHLEILVKSLEMRLTSGIHELERLSGITRDKRALCRRLNQLVVNEWRHSTGNGEETARSVVSLAPARPLRQPGSIFGPLTSVIKASEGPPPADASAREESIRDERAVDSSLSCAVTLSEFRVVEYIGSTSTFRVEVALKNSSSRVLLDAFVTLTLAPQPQVSADESSPASSVADRLTARSSVVTAFHPSPTADCNKATTFQVELTLERPPLRLLRGEQPLLAATVWLHWQASHDHRSRPVVLDYHRAASKTPASFAVASVSISAAEFMSTSGSRSVQANEARQELLLLSSGSSLPAWFARLQAPPHSSIDSPSLLTPTLVQPTFALASWAVGDRQAATFALGRALGLMPRDVFVMLNPLQLRHLTDVLRCLHGLRREILSVQRRAIVPPIEDAASDGDLATIKQSRDGEDRVAAFVRAYRRLQRETDLRIVDLLRALQLRADFHSTWVNGGVTA